LKARIPVDDDAMRELALQRAVAVRDAFVAKGLPAERLFLAAPKGKGDDAAWSPRVKLGLTLD
jgi:outer membrane protein OmpA-like peptidoglycan-associated protein